MTWQVHVDVFRGARQAFGKDPAGEEGQWLAGEWENLIDQDVAAFTSGLITIQRGAKASTAGTLADRQMEALRRLSFGDISTATTPMDAVYTATKHAVVGLVRSVAVNCADDGIRVNAVCPGFTDTAMIDGFREMLHQGGMPLVSVDDVAGAFFAVLAARCTGECFFVQPGRASEPFRFPSVPGPR